MCNPDWKEALKFLFRRDPSLPITEAVVNAVACNPNEEMALEFLLNRDPAAFNSLEKKRWSSSRI